MIWLLSAVTVVCVVSAVVLLFICRVLGQMAEGFSLVSANLEAAASARKEAKPVAWHVTFVAIIDHDARNAGVPPQERLYSGMQWIFGSRVLRTEVNGKTILSPGLLKDLARKLVNSEDVNHLELLNVIPLTASDVEADDFYNANKDNLVVSHTGDVK